MVYAPAFSVPTTFAQGDFGRNSIRGLSATQVDLALRRRIALRDRLSLTLSAEAFTFSIIPPWQIQALMSRATSRAPTSAPSHSR